MEVVVVTALDMRAAGGRALAQTLVVGKGTVALTPKQQRHRQRHQRVGGESAVPMAAVAGVVAEGVGKHRCQLEPVGYVAEGEGEVPRRVATAVVRWTRPCRSGLREHERRHQPRVGEGEVPRRVATAAVRWTRPRRGGLREHERRHQPRVLAAVVVAVVLLHEVVAVAVRLPLLRLLLMAVTVRLMTEAAMVMTRTTMVVVVAVALIVPRLQDGLVVVPLLRPRVAAVAAEALADGGESESSKGEEPTTQQRIDGMS
jgi:hypothetical protein